MSHLGHPLVGEKLHRSPACDAWPFPVLHSWCLELEDADGETLRVEAPLPEALIQAVERWGLEVPSSDQVGFWRSDG